MCTNHNQRSSRKKRLLLWFSCYRLLRLDALLLPRRTLCGPKMQILPPNRWRFLRRKNFASLYAPKAAAHYGKSGGSLLPKDTAKPLYKRSQDSPLAKKAEARPPNKSRIQLLPEKKDRRGKISAAAPCCNRTTKWRMPNRFNASVSTLILFSCPAAQCSRFHASPALRRSKSQRSPRQPEQR